MRFTLDLKNPHNLTPVYFYKALPTSTHLLVRGAVTSWFLSQPTCVIAFKH